MKRGEENELRMKKKRDVEDIKGEGRMGSLVKVKDRRNNNEDEERRKCMVDEFFLPLKRKKRKKRKFSKS